MISRYGKRPTNENVNQDKNNEQTATESRRVVMVYSDFNMEQFMAHATSGTSAAGVVASRAERQHSDDDDEVVVRSRAV